MKAYLSSLLIEEQSKKISNDRELIQSDPISCSQNQKGVSSHVADFNARNFQQGYRYHKLQKTFSKFYRRHYELVSKFNVGLKTLLHQGLSEPEFYGDLVYSKRL